MHASQMSKISELRSTLIQVYHPQYAHSLLSSNVHRWFRFGSRMQYQTRNDLALRGHTISIHVDRTDQSAHEFHKACCHDKPAILFQQRLQPRGIVTYQIMIHVMRSIALLFR